MAGPMIPAMPPSRFRAVMTHSAVRYLVAGGLSFVVDFGLLAVLHELAHWPVWLASGVAFLVSFAFTYTIQRVLAFGSKAPHGKALLKYTALVAFNTLATMAIVTWVNQSPLSWAGGKVLATAVTTVWNYFAYRYWVFAGSPADGPAEDAGEGA